MTPEEEAYAEAVWRIKLARESGEDVLDLGDLPLARLPDEIGDLTRLRVLVLGSRVPVGDGEVMEWHFRDSMPDKDFADIRPLLPLKNLVALGLSNTEVSDPSPLACLTGLRSLDLSGTKVSDPVSLAGLTGLQVLYLGCTRVAEAGQLAGLAGLQVLDLGGTKVSDAGPLARLSALRSLDLRGAKVSDVGPLAGLSALQKLDLSYTPVSDLAPLAGLSRLQSLNLAYTDVSDLSPLSGLTGLQSLDLTRTKVSDLAPLAGLAGLQSLNLSSTPVSDLGPLASLTGVKSLDLSITKVSDGAPLAGLTDLQTLNLSCTLVSNVGPLAGLAALQTLHLTAMPVVDLAPLSGLIGLQTLSLAGTPVSDLGPLAGLSALRWLNLSSTPVSDVGPMAGLSALQELYLRHTKVSDTSPLASLSGLRELFLEGSKQLSDLSPLAGLAGLRTLDIAECTGVRLFGPLRPLLESLEELRCFDCGFRDLPPEVCGDGRFWSVVAEVRAYYADLETSSASDAEVKLFVLGNAGVGKTQLCRRLCGLPYDASVASTHGVRVGHFRTEPGGDLPPVRVNLWDFGGQDVYHGSHALFLQGQAVFLVLWHPDSERGEYEEAGVRMRHHPLAYWLDYLRGLADADAPVLLIQGKCDDPRDKAELPAAALDGLPVDRLEFSARTDRGLDDLTAKLRGAVGGLLRKHPPYRIGRGRAAVRDRLRRMLEADLERPAGERQHRTVARADFDALCAEAGNVSSPEALLDFLHRTGVLFYRSGLFGDRIVLDQQWALDAVYALLDRARTLPALHNRGRFTRRDLGSLAWQGYSDDDQVTFLDMMEQCGICFRICQRSHDEPEYVAPELLPEYTEALRAFLAGRIPPGPADAEATARYPFLHEGILRTFLSRVGTKAGDRAVYWKYGCWFTEEKTASTVLIRGQWDDAAGRCGAGAVTFQAWGRRGGELLDALLEELQKTPVGRPPVVVRS
jgi:internalin A